MITPHPPTESLHNHPGPHQWAIRLALGAIVLLAVAGSLYWIGQNRLLMGRDASGHLREVLRIRESLAPFSLSALFNAVIASDFRPPLFYLVAQPFALLPLPVLNTAVDAPQLLNIFLHALLAPLVYLLSKRIASRAVGVLAALLVVLLPMTTAMGRLFYNEMLLTVLVLVNMLALYRIEGFRSGRWSLLWGASAGLGMLVKWTFPIYMIGPVLLILWEERRALLPKWRWDTRWAVGALVAGVLFLTVWWLPNREQAAQLPSHPWLPAAWLTVVVALVYSIGLARVGGHWLLPSMLLGVWIASFWYLPYPNLPNLLLAAEVEYANAPVSRLAPDRYARYWTYFYRQHLGTLLFWTLVPASMLPWLWTLLRKRASLNPRALLLWVSLGAAALILTQISQSNPRTLTPLLPQFAILASIGLLAWRPPWQWFFSGAAVLALLVQWSIVTFDFATPLRNATRALWVVDHYAMAPASGRTDPAYDIAPALLARVTRDTPAGALESLGMLTNADFLHRGAVRLLAEAEKFPVEIGDATEAGATWRSVIENQWVVVKDGDNRDIDVEALALVERIAAGDPLFHALYAPVAEYALPNRETVTLYQREGPGILWADPARNASTTALADALHTQVTDASTCVYADDEVAVWVGRFDLPCRPIVLANGWNAEAAQALGEVKGTIFDIGNDDDDELRHWLDTHGYKAGEIGVDHDYVVIYGIPDAPLQTIDIDAAWTLAEIALAGLRTQTQVIPGAVLPLDLRFAGVDGSPAAKLSMRLINQLGEIIAAVDREVLPEDRFGLYVPAGIQPGTLRVVERLYDPATLAPYPSAHGEDDVPLFEITLK